jgi:uncharacterized protein (DUF362 family)
MNDNRPGQQARREFIARCAKVCFSVAAASAVGIGLYEDTPPKRNPDRPEPLDAFDYSVAEMNGKICIARCAPEKINRASAVRQAFSAIGGIQNLVRPGEHVLLKVNAAFATPPLLGATSHPDLVEAMVDLCLEAGASNITITDNPINNPASCFALTGIEKAARSAGAKIILPAHHLFSGFTLAEGQLIRDWPVLLAPLAQADRVIGLAPVKDHHRSGASMTLKNWYGLLGGQRNIFHQNVHTIIQELSMMIKPTAVVLDGMQTMMTNGPTGGSLSDLKPTGTMIVSTDSVAADAVGAMLLGKQPQDLPFIAKAEKAGAGTADYGSLDLKEIQVV